MSHPFHVCYMPSRSRVYLFEQPINIWGIELLMKLGRVIAQEVSRRLPTAAARVRAQVRICEICSAQSGTGTGFLRVPQFPLPILIPPTARHSSSIIRDWYDRPIGDRRTKWTQFHPTPRNLKKNL
jgi:hypothetical protein